MPKKQIRQRPNPTYLQTYHFYNPIQNNHRTQPCRCNEKQCTNCDQYHNIIDHPITHQETKQQKQHKKSLGMRSQNQLVREVRRPFVIEQDTRHISCQRKQAELRGQLQEGGVYFFHRDPPAKCSRHVCCAHSKKLMPNDWKFNHTYHGTRGTMNQYFQYLNADYDHVLKQKYDFKHQLYDNHNTGPIFVFKQKQKTKNRKK